MCNLSVSEELPAMSMTFLRFSMKETGCAKSQRVSGSTFSSLRQGELKTVIGVVPECSALRRRVPEWLLLEHVQVLKDALSKYLALELLSLELKNARWKVTILHSYMSLQH